MQNACIKNDNFLYIKFYPQKINDNILKDN